MIPYNPFAAIGRFLIITGFLLAVAGLLVLAVSRSGFSWRVPGDILIQRKHLVLYFPIVSMLVLSVILTLIVNLFIRR